MGKLVLSRGTGSSNNDFRFDKLRLINLDF